MIDTLLNLTKVKMSAISLDMYTTTCTGQKDSNHLWGSSLDLSGLNYKKSNHCVPSTQGC